MNRRVEVYKLLNEGYVPAFTLKAKKVVADNKSFFILCRVQVVLGTIVAHLDMRIHGNLVESSFTMVTGSR